MFDSALYDESEGLASAWMAGDCVEVINVIQDAARTS